MAEWLYEAGIGEARAALVEDGRIMEARIEPDDAGPRAGTVADARLIAIEAGGRRGVARLGDGGEAMVEPLGKGWTQGAAVRVEIIREAITEPGRPKRSKARPSDAPPLQGPDLCNRIAATGVLVIPIGVHDPDALEAAGWSELVEAATRGEVTFEGGSLRVSPTPAMVLIDVDGWLAPEPLAIAAARAAAETIRAFDLTGSIGIDFPTIGSKAARLAAAATFDEAMPQPFERTAINGFGFMQIVRERRRPSLIERLRDNRASAEARTLLRRVQRSGLVGAVRLVVPPAIQAVLAGQPDWIDRLGRELGGTVALRSDAGLAISAAYAEADRP